MKKLLFQMTLSLGILFLSAPLSFAVFHPPVVDDLEEETVEALEDIALYNEESSSPTSEGMIYQPPGGWANYYSDQEDSEVELSSDEESPYPNPLNPEEHSELVWDEERCGTFPFADVDVTSKHYEAIHHFHCSGVVIGRAPDSFAPDEEILRHEVVKVVGMSLGIETEEVTGEYYSDVNLETVETAEYIEAFTELEIVEGYEDGNFNPHQAITESEIVSILQNVNLNTGHFDAYSNETVTREEFITYILETFYSAPF